MKKFLMAVLAMMASWFCSMPSVILAQDNLAQLRVPVHITKDLNSRWFVTSWLITNVVEGQPNNLNFFGGLGIRGKTWWAEGLLQRQWNQRNQWALNFRYNQSLGRKLNFYGELYPLSSEHSFAETAMLDYQLNPRLQIGAETENVHRIRPSSVGGGPHVGFRLWRRDKAETWAIATYHFRHNEPNFFRLYLVTTIKF